MSVSPVNYSNLEEIKMEKGKNYVGVGQTKDEADQGVIKMAKESGAKGELQSTIYQITIQTDEGSVTGMSNTDYDLALESAQQKVGENYLREHPDALKVQAEGKYETAKRSRPKGAGSVRSRRTSENITNLF
jgi:hypothetical protein